MKRSLFRLLLLLVTATGFVSHAFTMPLHPDLLKRLKAEGRLDEVVEISEKARAKGVWEPNPNPEKYEFATTGSVTQPAIVLIADFSDNVGARPQSDIDEMLFSVGTYPTGSMTDYFLENSYGNLTITGTVTIWLRMPQTYAYYVNGQNGFGSYPRNAQKLVEDAVAAANPLIDFSLFDGDGNGYVDALFVVHAGPGAEQTGNPNDIWSHAWRTSSPVLVDGVYAYRYAMEPEDGAIGVFGHEMGHSVFNLPDLYDTDYTSNGLGRWSMMAGGSWGGGGTRPVHFDAWCKSQVGFVSPIVVMNHIVDAPLPAVEWTPTIYRLWTGGTIGPQYFLVENRQKVGFDGFIPGNGLLIFHVDEIMSNNRNESHYKVDLEQADGLRDLNNNVNSGDARDPYPGTTNNLLFDRTTNPNSKAYFGAETQVAVWNISPSDSLMTANLDVLFWIPRIEVVSTEVQDPMGNNDGRADPGETVDLIVTLTNYWMPATNVLGTLSTTDPDITIGDPNGSFGSISTDELVDNTGDPFSFTVDPLAEVHFATFLLDISSDGGAYTTTESFTLMIGRPDILLVDDDEGPPKADYETYYTSSLDNLGLFYDSWDRQIQGAVTSALPSYSIVIWFTGDATTGTLTPQDEIDLQNFLDGGGRLFITSQNLGEDIGSRPFYANYLKASFLMGNANDNLLSGVLGDEVSDGINLVIQGVNGAGNANSEDKISPLAGADSVFSYTNALGTAAVKFDSGVFRVVYFAFPFEAIHGSGPFASRDTVMVRVLFWLDPTTVGVEEENSEFRTPNSEFRLFQSSPNPFHRSTLIRYSLPASGLASLKVFDITGRLVETLVNERQEPGVYQVEWEGKEQASGIYFYRLTTGVYTSTRKLILMK
ncbi:M6 family metalloprotease domain-containing protein [candidate division TA06 bacterium]|nr:M6 family metalloprotease domain-containing protein [candidate division TA06 bacterium]